MFQYSAGTSGLNWLRLLLVAMLLTAAVPAWARLGETAAQLEARYGNGHMVRVSGGIKADPDEETFVYSKNGIRIQATLVNGVCMRLWMQAKKRFSEEEEQALLKANGEGKLWISQNPKEDRYYGKLSQRAWVRTDRKARAYSSHRSMYIVYQAYFDLLDAQKARADQEAANRNKSRLEGF